MTPRKRKTGNPAGKVGSFEVKKAGISAAEWTPVATMLSEFGWDIVNQTPVLSFSMPLVYLPWVVGIGFLLILVGKLWLLKRSDNTDRE